MYASPWEAALSALEWGKITARLAHHASSEPGRDLCAALSPGTDLDDIRASLEENRDGRRMLLQDGALPLDEAKEIREEVGKAAKGASLSPTELLRIGKTARVGERVRRFFEDRRGRYPRLAHHANGIPPLRDLAEAVERAIDANGNVLDRASEELGPLRRQLLKMRSRLQETAEGILSSPRYARHVQETYATIRSGRVVIPFKASAKGLFQGIVHDSSQSGQTVFFEPEELVHLNNEVKMAELEVEREVARILAELSGRIARREEELLLALSLLARIDAIQARSLLADELSAEAIEGLIGGLAADIGNINSTRQVVLSGEAGAISEAEARLQTSLDAPALRFVRLNVSAPFHSRLLEPICAPFAEILREWSSGFDVERAGCVVSNYRGGFHSGGREALIENLILQISHTVQWKQNMTFLASQAGAIWEIGPGRPLRDFFRTIGVTCTSVTNLASAEKAFSAAG